MSARKKLISGLFYGSLTLTIVAWMNRDNLDDSVPWVPALANAPYQSKIDEPAYQAVANDITYEIQPLYEYELTGLVVSFNRFTPGIGLHERWQDYINVADVCVVWGRNATDVDLTQFKFWNLEFTCNFQTHSQSAWEAFDQDALSNNHLLSTDPLVHDVLEDLRIGDIVRIQGKLVEYGQPGQPVRGTSITRKDRGNGACETIHVQHAAIIESMDNPWRPLFWLGVFGTLLALILWFTAPHHTLR